MKFKEWFARSSFDRDLREECFDKGEAKSFDDLPEHERAVYFDEAKYYIEEHDFEDWPVDILESMKNIK